MQNRMQTAKCYEAFIFLFRQHNEGKQSEQNLMTVNSWKPDDDRKGVKCNAAQSDRTEFVLLGENIIHMAHFA